MALNNGGPMIKAKTGLMARHRLKHKMSHLIEETQAYSQLRGRIATRAMRSSRVVLSIFEGGQGVNLEAHPPTLIFLSLTSECSVHTNQRMRSRQESGSKDRCWLDLDIILT